MFSYASQPVNYLFLCENVQIKDLSALLDFFKKFLSCKSCLLNLDASSFSSVYIVKNICPISELTFHFNSFLRSRADVNIDETALLTIFSLHLLIFCLKKGHKDFIIYFIPEYRVLEKPETLPWTGIWVGINVKGFLTGHYTQRYCPW